MATLTNLDTNDTNAVTNAAPPPPPPPAPTTPVEVLPPPGILDHLPPSTGVIHRTPGTMETHVHALPDPAAPINEAMYMVKEAPRVAPKSALQLMFLPEKVRYVDDRAGAGTGLYSQCEALGRESRHISERRENGLAARNWSALSTTTSVSCTRRKARCRQRRNATSRSTRPLQGRGRS